MPVVANYELFSDSTFTLNAGNSVRSFTQSIGNTPAAGEGAVLMWKARVTGGSPVTYRVLVNGNQVDTHSLSQGNLTSLYEVIGTNDINSGNNTVSFERVSGGTIRLSDVMMLYRNNV